MNSDWQKITIEEIASQDKTSIAIGPFGSRMKSDCYVNKGIPVIRGQNITDGIYPEGEFVYITEEKADELKSSQVFEGDLVFPHRGAIGKVALVRDSCQMVLSSSLMKLTPDKDKCSSEFLLYFFRSRIGQYELLKNASTVGTPGIGQPLSSLKSIYVLLPSLGEQKEIAQILRTLDEKIELNKKTNETLKGITEALFKSWFIDFDPVKSKKENFSLGLSKDISDLFTDSFEDSIFGKIPQSWMVSKFGNLCTPKRGKVITKKTIIPGEIPVVAGGINPAYYHSRSNASSPVVTISASGNAGYVNIFYKDIWASDCSYINKNVTDFIYFSHGFLKINQNKIFHLRHGAVQQHINPQDLMGLDIVLPPVNLINKFEQIVTPLHNKISNNLNEINTLSSLRDLLLPKLVSGELKIKDSQKSLEESGI